MYVTCFLIFLLNLTNFKTRNTLQKKLFTSFSSSIRILTNASFITPYYRLSRIAVGRIESVWRHSLFSLLEIRDVHSLSPVPVVATDQFS